MTQKKYKVPREGAFFGGNDPVYIFNFSDGTTLSIAEFSIGHFNLGGEVFLEKGDTYLTSAGVVKNLEEYEKDNYGFVR